MRGCAAADGGAAPWDCWLCCSVAARAAAQRRRAGRGSVGQLALLLCRRRRRQLRRCGGGVAPWDCWLCFVAATAADGGAAPWDCWLYCSVRVCRRQSSCSAARAGRGAALSPPPPPTAGGVAAARLRGTAGSAALSPPPTAAAAVRRRLSGTAGSAALSLPPPPTAALLRGTSGSAGAVATASAARRRIILQAEIVNYQWSKVILCGLRLGRGAPTGGAPFDGCGGGELMWKNPYSCQNVYFHDYQRAHGRSPQQLPLCYGRLSWYGSLLRRAWFACGTAAAALRPQCCRRY